MSARKTDRMLARIKVWQDALGLGSWEIGYSPLEPDHDEERASVETHPTQRRAVVRVRSTTPESQIDRELVHELIHVLQAGMADLFERSVADHGTEAQAFLRGQWERECEWMIERLTDAITGIPHAEVPMSGPTWTSAFPA